MFEIEDKERLARIETKLVRFAEEMGIDISSERDTVTVDCKKKVFYLSNRGRSLFVLQKEAKRQGAEEGDRYDLVYKRRSIGELKV